MNIEITRYTRIEEDHVVVRAYAYGKYGAKHEDDGVMVESAYTNQFNLEELISSISIEAAIEFYKKYGEEPYVSSITIMREEEYDDFLRDNAEWKDCRNPQ